MMDGLTPSGPEGSSGRLILMCRRVPGHFCVWILALRCGMRDAGFEAFTVEVVVDLGHE